MNRWFSTTGKPSASAHILRAQGYYQLRQFDLALVDVERAIDMEKSAGKVPKEPWYGLARFLYFESKQMSRVIETLNELSLHYPDGQYWVQLSHMYGETGDDAKQLGALQSAYEQNYLTRESDLLNLAYLYFSADVPYKAAIVVEAGLQKNQIKSTEKNLKFLGDSWRRAQEWDKAIPVLQQSAEL